MAENGGWVVSGNEDVFNCQLPVHHFNAVVDHLQTLPNIEIIACGKRSAYTLNRYNDALKTVAAKYYHRLELVDDFNHLDDTILKFGLNVPDSLIPEIQPKLHAALGDMVTAVATGYGSIDLIIPGVHKANGLRILQQRWGIEDHEVVAFGDSGNDIEMLQHAGLALPWPTPGKTSKPSPAIRRRITTKKVSCRLLIRCWIAKRRSPDKTRMRAHPG
ncbi:hydrolase [Klebsiella pneumoniae]|uniref:Hydrolase n=1 Tax=Klebsiella pneumoniae TaxID=573 RepID=A0A377XRB7_KLEPN|nr:hydrolase [Klebsiella pneumoniae]